MYSNYMLLIREHLKCKKVKGKSWKKVHHVDINLKNPGEVVLISDKVASRVNIITSDKEGHFLMAKWLIYLGDIMVSVNRLN